MTTGVLEHFQSGDTSLGHPLFCPQLMVSSLQQVERERYGCGVKWLYDILYGLQFPADRVAVVATKMVNDVAR